MLPLGKLFKLGTSAFVRYYVGKYMSGAADNVTAYRDPSSKQEKERENINIDININIDSDIGFTLNSEGYLCTLDAIKIE